MNIVARAMKDVFIEFGNSEGTNALYEYLHRPAASESIEAVLEYEDRIKVFQEFSSKHLQQASRSRPWPKHLTYPMLYELLVAEKMTLSECYKVMFGIEIKWPYKEMPALAEKFDLLSDEAKSRYIQVEENLLSDFITRINGLRLSPSEKLIEATFQLYTANDRKSAPTSFSSLGRGTASNPNAVLPFRAFPEVAAHFRLPLHWLLCADDALTEFGNHPLTQKFMDYYTLLPKKTQLFMQAMIG